MKPSEVRAWYNSQVIALITDMYNKVWEEINRFLNVGQTYIPNQNRIQINVDVPNDFAKYSSEIKKRFEADGWQVLDYTYMPSNNTLDLDISELDLDISEIEGVEESDWEN